MGAVSIAEAWPPAGRPFTVDELDRMPHDGRRYELLGGVLVVSPRPSTVHQAVATRLIVALSAACPPGLLVVPEPAVSLSRDTEFDPDIVVVRLEDVGGAKFTGPPLLTVEIRSASTAMVDLNVKKAAYERFGVGSYWIVDPGPRTPSLTAFELRDGHYAQIAQARGGEAFRADRPFRADVVPSDLVAGLSLPPR
jgi:Uma2 family endonuclease